MFPRPLSQRTAEVLSYLIFIEDVRFYCFYRTKCVVGEIYSSKVWQMFASLPTTFEGVIDTPMCSKCGENSLNSMMWKRIETFASLGKT